MKVVEIFNSIEGEGKRIGQPCTFIRLFGCNLRCAYCDSMYAVEGNEYQEMSISDIMEQVGVFGCFNVTVTGGEPLIHSNIQKLLNSLVRKGYWVNVETNGSIGGLYYENNDRLFYTVDFKTPNSNMMHKMDLDMYSKLHSSDVLKFVVGGKDDLQQARRLLEDRDIKATIFVSPEYGKIEPVDIVNYVKEHKLWNWTVQVQLHKIIWSPDEKGV